MKLINKIKEKPLIEYLIVSCILIGVSVAFASYVGILNSGYHFTDDHEIIEINYQIKNIGFFNTLIKTIGDDLSWRFRPIYLFFRVIRTWLFGTNFYWWHLTIAVECGMFMAFSYILARKMKAPIISSFVFSFIFLIGSQDEMIWRLGPQENIGMFFMPLAFLFTLIYYETQKKNIGILAVVTTIFMMLSKESFLVLGPSVLLFLLYLFIKNNAEDKNIFKKIWDFIKKYKYIIISICSVLLISLAIIVLFVGLMESGYAGIDTSYTLGEYIRITLNVFIRDLVDYWAIFGLVIILLIYSIIYMKIKGKLDRHYWQVVLVGFIFIAYSIGIEALLYAKSAMFNRYKIPMLWFLYFALMVLESQHIKPIVHSIIVICVCAFTFFMLENTGTNIYQDAKYYADEGEKTTELLNYIGEIKNKKNGIVVLTNYSWYEHNYSASMYLQLEKGIENVFYLDDERDDGDYKKIYGNSDKRISIKEADVILTDEENVEYYSEDEYQISKYFSYYVLEKK